MPKSAIIRQTDRQTDRQTVHNYVNSHYKAIRHIMLSGIVCFLYFKEDMRMKKSIFLICMAAVILTGCGSNSGGTSKAEESGSKSDTVTTEASQEEKEDKTEAVSQESAESEEIEYRDFIGIDMPIPAGMEEHVRSRKKNLRCLFGGSDEEPVYYAFFSSWL